MCDFFDTLSEEELIAGTEYDYELRKMWEFSLPVFISGWTSAPQDIHSILREQGIQYGLLYVGNQRSFEKEKEDKFFLLALNLNEKIHEDSLLLRIILSQLLDKVTKYINVALMYLEDGKLQVYKKWQLSVERFPLLRKEISKSTELFKDEIKGVELHINDPMFISEIDIRKIESLHESHIRNSVIIPQEVINSLERDFSFFESALSNDDFYFFMTQSLDDKIKVPIYIRKEQKHYSELWPYIKNKKDEYMPNIELLGYYSQEEESFDGQECNGSHIVLCTDNIEKVANESRIITKELLYKVVLVHELAHAMMSNKTMFTEFEALAMEESLANSITLQYFFENDRDNYNRVYAFIKEQPTIYSFGTYQFEANVDWLKWKECNKDMPTLNDWFDHCFCDGKIKTDLDYTSDDYNKVF